MTDSSKEIENDIRSILYPALGGDWTQETEDKAVAAVQYLIDNAVNAARIDELEHYVLNRAYFPHDTGYEFILALHIRKRLAELSNTKEEADE